MASRHDTWFALWPVKTQNGWKWFTKVRRIVSWNWAGTSKTEYRI